MKYYCFQYLTEDDKEIIVKTESKEKTNTIAKFIQSWFKPKNSEGYFYEEDERSFEEER